MSLVTAANGSLSTGRRQLSDVTVLGAVETVGSITYGAVSVVEEILLFGDSGPQFGGKITTGTTLYLLTGNDSSGAATDHFWRPEWPVAARRRGAILVLVRVAGVIDIIVDVATSSGGGLGWSAATLALDGDSLTMVWTEGGWALIDVRPGVSVAP